MDLDPTSRRLGSVEKFRRSQQILDLAEKAALECVTGQPPEPLPELLANSAKLKAEKTGPMPSNEAAETRLELAVQLWNARPRACQTKPADEDPLAIIIAKMEQ
jgi:hypothetical protein